MMHPSTSTRAFVSSMTAPAITEPQLTFVSTLWRSGFPFANATDHLQSSCQNRRRAHCQYYANCLSPAAAATVAAASFSTITARRPYDRHDHTPRSPRKTRRKTAEDVKRDRKSRMRSDPDRPTVIAVWAGVVLAETKDYEVSDRL